MQSHTVTAYQRVGAVTRRLGPVQSPVVSSAITRRANEVRAFSALKRATASFLASLFLLVDLSLCLSSFLVTGTVLLLVQCTEVGAVIILLLSFLHDTTLCIGTHFMQEKIRLTPEQSVLMGIENPTKEEGYEVVSDPVPFGVPHSSTPVPGHTSMHPHYYMTPLPSTPVPGHYHMTPVGSANSSAHSTPHSSSTNHTPTPTSLRGQRVYRPSSSPFSKDPVADAHSLECYLKQEEEKEQHLLRGSLDLTPSQGYSGHFSSHTPSPRKYHIAPRSTSPSICHGPYDSPHYRKDDSSLGLGSSTYSGVKKVDLDRWTERCRKWIALSVVKPLAEEINSINSTLSRKGVSEQIGTVSISSLKHIAKSKSQHLPTLSLVIPYLEVSPKQEYLVERIRELSQGSYLSTYRWDSGGSWKGRAWSIDLPNDSQIVMHLLSTYFDNHLPPDPWFPDGKTFSTQYFLKAPPKNGSKQQGVCIVQDNHHPPTYKVLVKGKYIEVSEGRNNLFHSICIFLHHVKAGEKSMLGSINLETSGINILSIISPVN